jgi:PPE-repeat protein
MNLRSLIAVFVAIILVVFGSILIFSIDWGGSKKQEVQNTQTVALTDYAQSAEATVTMYARGPVVNNKQHESLRITVGRDKTVGELLSGYQDKVIKTETTSNNPNSFRTFLSAILNANVTKTQEGSKTVDVVGACPTGTQYTFSYAWFGDNGPKESWAVSCSKRTGTFAGDLSMTKKLFITQLPENQYRDLTENTLF